MKSIQTDLYVNSRRTFIKQTSVMGSVLMLAGAAALVAANGDLKAPKKNLSKGYAGTSTTAIGGIPETQEVINYCAEHHILPEIPIIPASQINDAWEKVVNN